MDITCIVAKSLYDDSIGKDNTLPWKCPEDMKHFKDYTSGKVVIMGTNTWNSLPIKPLPNRKNIVVTRKGIDTSKYTGLISVNSIESAILLAHSMGYKEAVIMGGAEIYKHALPYCNKVVVTEIDCKVEDADAFFPKLSGGTWKNVKIDHISDIATVYYLERIGEPEISVIVE